LRRANQARCGFARWSYEPIHASRFSGFVFLVCNWEG
jgi:hypothetical protein